MIAQGSVCCKRALGPEFRGLTLDGDARGVADEPVGMPEMRPRFLNGFGAGAFVVQTFEFDAQLVLGRLDRRRRGRGVSLPA